jgi:transposase-like protein
MKATQIRLNIPALAVQIPDEAAAYELMENLRWDGRPVCPHCGSVAKHYFLTPKNPEGRKTRTGSVSARRVWKCKDCRRQFSVLTGTIFHGSKVPLRTWLFVVVEMCASKNGLAAREVERKYAVSTKTAWFMTQRIREAMKRGGSEGLMSGVIQADEAYIGGTPRFRHKGKRDSDRGRGTDKTPVVSLLDTATGEVRSKVVPNVTGASLHAVMERELDMDATTLHTDGFVGYKWVAPEFAAHESVDHHDGEYVRGNVTTNHVEGFFSQLKRSIDGTFHHVSVEHLQRYLNEFDFRYTTREMSDAQRVRRLMGQTAGRRLAYRPLTGG